MTISSSLNAGVAGLAANASRLAGIADNIANSATDGYRRVTTDFASLAGVQGPSLYTAGGVRPAAYVAGGVRTTSIRLIDEAGPITSSANATDLAVSGRGFLPVTNAVPPEGGSTATELRLTSTGAFRPGADGVLRDAEDQILLGWPADAQGNFPEFPRQSVAGLEAVRIDSGFVAGEATDRIQIEANLPATATEPGASGDPLSMTTEYYDALGALRTLELTYTPDVPAAGDPATNTWTLTIADNAGDAASNPIGEYTLVFNDERAVGGTLESVTPISGGAYDAEDGSVALEVAGGPMTLRIGELGRPGGLTQLADTFAPAASRTNGAPPGTISALEVLDDGTVRAISDSGIIRPLYRIPLVDVPNPNGLRSETGTTFAISSESGPFYLWDAGDGPAGTVAAFSRLESATDVAAELTDLIQTQRAYSSNATIIRTVDEMLQETTNLKR